VQPKRRKLSYAFGGDESREKRSAVEKNEVSGLTMGRIHLGGRGGPPKRISLQLNIGGGTVT